MRPAGLLIRRFASTRRSQVQSSVFSKSSPQQQCTLFRVRPLQGLPLACAIISDGKLSVAPQNAALWEMSNGKKVQRLDVLSTADKLDGATVLLEAELPKFLRLICV